MLTDQGMAMRPGLSRVAARRRAGLRLGLLAIVIVSAGIGTTACIFDQSEYQGGGRIGRAATAQQEKQSDGTDTPDDDTPSTPPTGTTSPTTIPPDAGPGADF